MPETISQAAFPKFFLPDALFGRVVSPRPPLPNTEITSVGGWDEAPSLFVQNLNVWEGCFHASAIINGAYLDPLLQSPWSLGFGVSIADSLPPGGWKWIN